MKLLSNYLLIYPYSTAHKQILCTYICVYILKIRDFAAEDTRFDSQLCRYFCPLFLVLFFSCRIMYVVWLILLFCLQFAPAWCIMLYLFCFVIKCCLQGSFIGVYVEKYLLLHLTPLLSLVGEVSLHSKHLLLLHDRRENLVNRWGKIWPLDPTPSQQMIYFGCFSSIFLQLSLKGNFLNSSTFRYRHVSVYF